MTLRIYNTLSCRMDELVPGGVRKENIADYPPVTMYSCGPTVYSYAHIGNFRTFLFNDILRRYLKFRGYKVDHTMNITDVDDKTINGAVREGITLKEFTERYTEIFFQDLVALNIETVEHIPRATESIEAMIDIIRRLEQQGLMYEKEGSLYFSIAKFDRYGRLSRLESRETKSGARYDADEYEKDDVRDFALWKAPKDEMEISWDTPWGKGRPGWHIECSAMIRQIYGRTIDIHTGGVDLIFPHHENEIAQSEAAYNEPFVRHWIHVEHLLVNNRKMSKSEGNFYTLRDLLDRGYSARPIRYLLIAAHYRKQLNFTLDGLSQADQALERIDNMVLALREVKSEGALSTGTTERIDKFLAGFTEALDDDLNISGGLGAVFDLVHDANRTLASGSITRADADAYLAALERVDSVLGVIFFPETGNIDTVRIDALVAERIQAKKDKNFARADEIRKQLLDEGIILEDTKDGTRWKIKK